MILGIQIYGHHKKIAGAIVGGERSCNKSFHYVSGFELKSAWKGTNVFVMVLGIRQAFVRNSFTLVNLPSDVSYGRSPVCFLPVERLTLDGSPSKSLARTNTANSRLKLAW